MTRDEMCTFVEGLIVENFGSMEEFVLAFPSTFEVEYVESEE